MRPNPGPAPSPVSTAALIQYATVALAVVGGVLSILTTRELVDVLPGALAAEGYTPEERDAVVTGASIASYGLVALWVVFALLFASFAIFYQRGARWARFCTFAVAGLLVLCGVCALPGGGTIESTTTTVDQALDAATPNWWGTANLVVQILSFAAYAAIIVLLALPVAREFFRKQVAPSLPDPAAEVSE